MRDQCLRLLAHSSEVLSTGFSRVAEAARSRTSKSPSDTTTDNPIRDLCGSSRTPHRDACSTSGTETCGGSRLPSAATHAGRSTSPSPTERDSESVDSVGVLFELGSREDALDLLTGMTKVLGHTIRAAWNLGDDLVGDSLEGLMENVLDAADVITEGEIA